MRPCFARPFFLSCQEFVVTIRKGRHQFSWHKKQEHLRIFPSDTVVVLTVLGNAGTIISFRIGAEDSPYMVREFAGYLEEIDLLHLPNHRIYLKLMIEGAPSKPFSAIALSPSPSSRNRI
jgi:hypothetical protein